MRYFSIYILIFIIQLSFKYNYAQDKKKHQYYDSKGYAHSLVSYFEPAKIPDTGAYNYDSLTAPEWMTNIGQSMGGWNTQNTDIREAIEAGVHVVWASGNSGHYCTKPGDCLLYTSPSPRDS